MRDIVSLLIVSGLSVSLLGQERGQSAASRTSASSTVRTSSEEVLLDVVVRDKKGRRVDDLKPEDFQILDNGEPKKITSFRLVRGREAIGAGGTRAQLDPLRQIRLLRMLFHSSDRKIGHLPKAAALNFLK